MDRNKPAAITVDSGLKDGESFRFRLNKVTRGRGSHVRDLEHMLGEPYHMEKVVINSAGGRAYEPVDEVSKKCSIYKSTST